MKINEICDKLDEVQSKQIEFWQAIRELVLLCRKQQEALLRINFSVKKLDWVAIEKITNEVIDG